MIHITRFAVGLVPVILVAMVAWLFVQFPRVVVYLLLAGFVYVVGATIVAMFKDFRKNKQ